MWVEVDGGQLYVEEAGTGPPILLLHGWPLDHRVFEPQRESLSADFRLIMVDRRGFGRATAPPDLRRETEDIDRIIDALDLDAVHLLGMSQGGRIALRYAVTRQHRVRSLILQGAIVDGLNLEESEADRLPVEHFAALARAGELDEVRRLWRAHPMMALDRGLEMEQRLVDQLLKDYSGSDLLIHDAAAYDFDTDVLGLLANFSQPTLLLTGDRETHTRQQHAREIAARVPNVREVRLAHSGHLCNLTEPAAYNRAVRQFCSEVESARALL
jgi:pimeloyl-ACP methyl ester carboxylesterase